MKTSNLFIKTAAVALLSWAAVSCVEPVEAPTVFTVSGKSLVIEADGSVLPENQIKITSTGNWLADPTGDWMTTVNGEPCEELVLDMMAQPNESHEQRKADIYVSTKGYAPVVIPAVQKGFMESLEISMNEASVEIDGTSEFTELTVNSNIAWTADNSSCPWVKLLPASGEKGETKVAVSYDANPGAARTGSVKFMSGDVKYAELTVTQKGKAVTFEVTPAQMKADGSGKLTSEPLKVVSNTAWKAVVKYAEPGLEWITLKNSEGDASQTAVEIGMKILNNPINEVRSADIVITAGTEVRTINLEQAGNAEPEGSKANPIQVIDAKIFRDMAGQVRGGDSKKGVYYVLMKDIDLSGSLWYPIGTYKTPFMGNVDGNGKTIKGMLIDGTKGNYYQNPIIGFFAQVAEGSIRDLTIEGEINLPEYLNNSGEIFIGGLAGRAGNVTLGGKIVSKVKINVISKKKDKSKMYVGGVFGSLSYYNNGVISPAMVEPGAEFVYDGLDKNKTIVAQTFTETYVGGIFGKINKMEMKAENISCTATNSQVDLLSHNASCGAGGIIGYADIDADVISPSMKFNVNAMAVSVCTVLDQAMTDAVRTGSAGVIGKGCTQPFYPVLTTKPVVSDESTVSLKLVSENGGATSNAESTAKAGKVQALGSNLDIANPKDDGKGKVTCEVYEGFPGLHGVQWGN